MGTIYNKIINKLFPKDILYVRAHRTKIEIRNVKTGQEISYAVSQTYSNSRMLIADFFVFEEQLRNAINEIKEQKLINRSLRIVFQPIDEAVTEFSPVEKRVFRDSCEYAGAAELFICRGQDKLTNQDIMDGINGEFVKAKFER